MRSMAADVGELPNSHTCDCDSTRIVAQQSLTFSPCSVLQHHVFKTLENDPVFARQPGEDVPLERMRELTFLRYEHDRKFHLFLSTMSSQIDYNSVKLPLVTYRLQREKIKLQTNSTG